MNSSGTRFAELAGAGRLIGKLLQLPINLFLTKLLERLSRFLLVTASVSMQMMRWRLTEFSACLLAIRLFGI